MFGKLIPLSPDAQDIMNEYDLIMGASKDVVVESLTASRIPTAATYYQNTGKAFIFDIQLVQDYLAEAIKRNAKYVVLIKAANSNQTPTLVFTAAHSEDKKEFFIIPTLQGEVLEHPENGGTVGPGDGFNGGITLVFSLDE